MRLAMAAALLLVFAGSGTARSPADRTIDGVLPVWSAQITVSLAAQIARLARIPLGIEAFPRNPAAPLLKPDERRDLRGVTVREALDWLVRIDPRYRWTEMDGVVVIRPAAAWDDPEHVLAAALGEVAIESWDARSLLSAVRTFLQTGAFEVLPGDGAGKRLPIALPRASVLDVLNAAARTAALVWEIDYGTRMPRQPSLWLRATSDAPGGDVGVDLPLPLPSWLAAAADSRAPAERASPADRLIEGVVIHTRRRLDTLVAMQIAKYAKVPLGFEVMPPAASDPESRLPVERQKVLTYLTVREALDWLVELDPRYHWVESRGVIVIRPVEAWGDPKHFLNRMVGPFSVEERDALDVLWAIGQLVDHGTFGLSDRPAPVWLPITMSIQEPLGVLEVLNELAYAGSLYWMIHYDDRPDWPGHPVRIDIGDIERYRQGGGSLPLRQPLPRWLRGP